MGLLLRRSDAVNRVAAPVKFAEYLASGTPVLLTDGIGDYSAAVREHGLGAVVNLDQPDGDLAVELKRFLSHQQSRAEELRNACRAYAEDHFSWDRHAEKTRAVYESLNAGPGGVIEGGKGKRAAQRRGW
jgi:glycosyltransferase involved in cell wall biosynthesis